MHLAYGMLNYCELSQVLTYSVRRLLPLTCPGNKPLFWVTRAKRVYPTPWVKSYTTCKMCTIQIGPESNARPSGHREQAVAGAQQHTTVCCNLCAVNMTIVVYDSELSEQQTCTHLLTVEKKWSLEHTTAYSTTAGAAPSRNARSQRQKL